MGLQSVAGPGLRTHQTSLPIQAKNLVAGDRFARLRLTDGFGPRTIGDVDCDALPEPSGDLPRKSDHSEPLFKMQVGQFVRDEPRQTLGGILRLG